MTFNRYVLALGALALAFCAPAYAETTDSAGAADINLIFE